MAQRHHLGRVAAIVSLFLGLVVHGAVAGEIDPEQGCRGNPELVGPCFSIHGRLGLTNGTPGVRIWRIGTRRILGVILSENEIMPANVKRHLAWGTTIYGDFEVCPFTPQRSGEMQMICVESARRLVLERYVDDSNETIVTRLRDEPVQAK
jgi:hypothetical protein